MRTNTKLAYILPILAALAIFIASSFPGYEVPNMPIMLGDKIVHFAVYFVLGLSILISLVVDKNHWTNAKIIMMSIILGAIYGASDEFHQSFVPGRSVELLDWLADCLGVAFSSLFINQVRQITTFIYTKWHKTSLK